jgi:YHS domain-containing protein
MKTSAMKILITTASFVLLAAVVLAAPATKGPEPMCPVSNQPCDPEVSLAFDGGSVWFCCEKCEKAFEADSAKFAAKAHQQMVVTGELVQKGCPFSGGPVKPGTQLDIGGATVGFCCNNCKGKVAKAGPDEQVDMVFGSIAKGFAPKE